MDLAWFVYAADVLGAFKWICITASVCLGILIGIGMLAVSSASFWEKPEILPTFKKALIAFLMASILAVFIPSEKTTYMMLGGYSAQNVLESGTADKVKQIIDKKLDEYLKEEKK